MRKQNALEDAGEGVERTQKGPLASQGVPTEATEAKKKKKKIVFITSYSYKSMIMKENMCVKHLTS